MKIFEKIKGVFKNQRHEPTLPEIPMDLVRTVFADEPILLVAKSKVTYDTLYNVDRSIVEHKIKEELLRGIFNNIRDFINVEIRETPCGGLYGQAKAVVMDAKKPTNVPRQAHVEISCCKLEDNVF